MTDFERLGHGFVTYWKPIAATAVGLAILISAISWAAAHQRKTAREAREALAGAATVETLEKALADHAGSSEAVPARFRLAALLIQSKNYDKAIAQLRQIGDADGDASLAANAALTEAYALELSGKAADAAAKFSELAGLTTAPMAVRAEARYAAGRLLAMQKQLRKAAGLLAAARPNDPPQSVSDQWDDQSAALLRAIEAGEYGPIAAEPAAH
jgi:hypothetical protein